MLREDMMVAPNIQQCWTERTKQLPYLRFPHAWQVKVIPPHYGATVRFVVKQGDLKISVYCDFDHALGYFGKDMSIPEPYWEIYPNAYGDTSRFALHDTEGLLGAIAYTFATKQEADYYA